MAAQDDDNHDAMGSDARWASQPPASALADVIKDHPPRPLLDVITECTHRWAQFYLRTAKQGEVGSRVAPLVFFSLEFFGCTKANFSTERFGGLVLWCTRLWV